MASVDKRPGGQWRARWREYPGGPQRPKSFGRKVDAEQHLVRVQHDLFTGAYVDPAKGRTTVEGFYRVWSGRQPWRASTRAAVATIFDGHVLPALGGRPLGTVRRGDLEAWAAGLPLASSTIRLAMQHVASMFAAAVGDGLLAANPADGVKRPREELALAPEEWRSRQAFSGPPGVKRPGRAGHPIGFYLEVARVYASAPKAPTKAVADALNVGRATASSLVSDARHRHHLLTDNPRVGVGGAVLTARAVELLSAQSGVN